MSDAPPRVHLAAGILERDGAILLVASRYRNHPAPLWNLPGGRQRPNELLPQTVEREFREETGLSVEVAGLRYVAESYDPTSGTHFTSTVFDVGAAGEPRTPPDDAHVCELAWSARSDLQRYLSVAVVREPLLAHLADPAHRYFGYADAGITIEFSDAP